MDSSNTYLDATIRNRASDMQLYTDSDVSYLVLSKAHSRGEGYFYLNNKLNNMQTILLPTSTSPILTECQTLTHSLSSAAGAEVGTVFLNSKAAVPIRIVLEEIGLPQGSTPLKIDNNTA